MGKETDRVIGLLERALEQAVKQLTVEVTANLIESTPVDTGWARANWVPTIATAAVETVGSPDAVSSAGQQTGIATVIGSYRLGANGTPTFVTNNVPYIRRLNEGHSQKAPAGFVQSSADRAVSRVNVSGVKVTGG